jgi:hypothetical protein
MKVRTSIFVAGLSLMAAAFPLLAHHSFASGVQLEEAHQDLGSRHQGGMDEPPCALLC